MKPPTHFFKSCYIKSIHLEIQRFVLARQKLFPIAFMIALSITPVMSIHVPRFLAFWPLIIGLCGSGYWFLIKKEAFVYSKSYVAAIIGIVALCFASLTWSIAPQEAFEDAIKASAILLIGSLFISLCIAIPTHMLRPYYVFFPIGVAAAALLCSFELYNDMPIYRALRGIEPTEYLSSAVMNRGVVFTTFSALASIFFLQGIENKKTRLNAGAMMFVSLLVMLSLTQSQSGHIALGLGVFTFLLFPCRSKLPTYCLTVIIIMCIVLSPQIVTLLHGLLIYNGQEFPWLKDAYAGNRVEVWEFVMRYAMNNPLYGYGMEATRYVEAFEHHYIHHKSATVLHPHNFSIQIWIEFGLIGVALASALFSLLHYRINTFSLIDKRITLSLYIPILGVSAVGYGIWQSWWLGLLCFFIGACLLHVKKQ